IGGFATILGLDRMPTSRPRGRRRKRGLERFGALVVGGACGRMRPHLPYLVGSTTCEVAMKTAAQSSLAASRLRVSARLAVGLWTAALGGVLVDACSAGGDATADGRGGPGSATTGVGTGSGVGGVGIDASGATGTGGAEMDACAAVGSEAK